MTTKHYFDYDILAFISAWNQENYVDPDDPIIAPLISEKETPESLLLSKEKITSLSEEAQEVISIIFNAPQELLSMIPLHKENIAITKLSFYLKSMGWKRCVILKTFSEIKQMLEGG